MSKRDLAIIFGTFPDFNRYLTEQKRQKFMNDDDGFIADLENWKESSLSLLRAAKRQLEEILDSELMVQASRFAPWVKERWQGQLAIILELLDEHEKEA